ncbi:hypothetical protein Kfla_1870 [Kribbella flavida DSM 17836]|uniref:Uncharacterized protein n=1 Tax=Kribbella flavida (strain DSM 17836 / JCM 10339 / NBRC 14399) TaxID=479435 RepID=D2PPK2_KRIFD|nr:hypothetical protein Kfla_1870 [Kribbella flavida DSM 17836]
MLTEVFPLELEPGKQAEAIAEFVEIDHELLVSH